jgi:exosome complex exonuclease RRP6
MDIEWLQKDFGVYVVNMFDTFQASKFLRLPNQSLAYLLKEYCKVNANKEYQRADWRKRPLPKGKFNQNLFIIDMVKYAREDTHFLLYIYDTLRKEIVQYAQSSNLNPEDALRSVLNNSKEICLRTYTKPELKSEHYYEIMTRNKPILSNKKF